MSLSSWLRFTFTPEYRLNQRRMWQRANPSSRLLVLAAVFLLFAAVGLLGDITSLGRSSYVALALWAIVGGGFAVAYLLVATLRIWWMPAVVAAQVAASVLLSRLPQSPPLVPPGPAADALRLRLSVNAKHLPDPGPNSFGPFSWERVPVAT